MKTLVVQASRGESFCDEKGIIPQVLKIDVEGFENHVLAGFANVLDAIEIILIECWDLEKTIDLLHNDFGFLGPYKVDSKRHRFVSEDIHHEDWLFVNSGAARKLDEWMSCSQS